MSIDQNAAGANFTSTTASPTFGVGTRIRGANGSEWVYVQAAGAITGAGRAVVIDEDFQAAMVTTANALRGLSIGIAAAAFADDDYGWVQIYGVCDIQVAASCAANVGIAATATAGQLDDAVGTGTKNILGLVLTTARAASAGTAPGVLSYPTVYTTN